MVFGGVKMFENGCKSDTDAERDTDTNFERCPHVQQKSLGPKYILHVSGNSQTNPYIAVTLSDNTCEVFNVAGETVIGVARFNEHNDKLIGCKFSTENNALLYTGSSDGSVNLWDIRAPTSPAINFVDTTLESESDSKPISCFDVSANNRLLAAGTDLKAGDAYVLFWDVRNVKLLGAYWESHTDDITQVKFHPEDSNKLISGSTDGLINVYDLAEASEDDALQESLNTEALVEDLTWFREKGRYRISCVTSTVDLQLWDLDSAEPYRHLRRNDVADQIKAGEDETYIGQVLETNNHLMVIAGSDQFLRSFRIDNGKTLGGGLRFPENRQRVRCAWYNSNIDVLVTGGEKGLLDVWRPNTSK